MKIVAIYVYTENVCCAVDHRLYDQELALLLSQINRQMFCDPLIRSHYASRKST
jgi:hypothetical protein